MFHFQKEQFKTPEMTAVIAALIAGVITHLFALVNVFYNFDNIVTPYFGTGCGVFSGRWMLQTLGEVMEGAGLAHNLPMVGGLAFIFVVAVASGFAVSIFGIRSRTLAALMGMIFVVYPPIVGTMYYRYTTLHYGIAILLAVAGVWVLPRYKLGVLFSVLCIAASMGIYQAYVPLTISLLVLLLIQQGLTGEATLWQIVRRGFFYCGVLILAAVLYFVLVKVYLEVYGLWLMDYQGISQMGQIPLRDLPGLIGYAFLGAWLFPFFDLYDLVPVVPLAVGYVLLGILGLVMTGLILIRKVSRVEVRLAVLALLLVVLPVAVNFVLVMCASAEWFYVLMAYAFVVTPCIPIVIWEQLPQMEGKFLGRAKLFFGRAIAIVLALMVFFYSYYANVNYTASYHSTLQAENYANSIVVQVRMTEGFTADKKWALIGNIQDPMFSFDWEEGLTYGANESPTRLLNNYSRMNWFESLLGYDIPVVEEAQLPELAQMEAVRAMPCWPNAGSVRIIDDIVVIKFQELAQ